MEFATADLWDAHPDALSVLDAQFRGFGRHACFAGPCVTIRTREDHRPVRAVAATKGDGRVLVIDGGGSLRVAQMGDRIAAAPLRNGWAGAVVFGAIRDSRAIDRLEFGVKALGTTARRGEVEIGGERDLPLTFAGVTIRPGDWIYADPDAVVVSRAPLL